MLFFIKLLIRSRIWSRNQDTKDWNRQEGNRHLVRWGSSSKDKPLWKTPSAKSSILCQTILHLKHKQEDNNNRMPVHQHHCSSMHMEREISFYDATFASDRLYIAIVCSEHHNWISVVFCPHAFSECLMATGICLLRHPSPSHTITSNHFLLTFLLI